MKLAGLILFSKQKDMNTKENDHAIRNAEGAGATGDVQWQSIARFGSRIKRACQNASAIIAPSAAIASELVEAGYATERVHRIANGVTIGPPRASTFQATCRGESALR